MSEAVDPMDDFRHAVAEEVRENTWREAMRFCQEWASKRSAYQQGMVIALVRCMEDYSEVEAPE